MTYFKFITNSDPVYRSFDSDNFIVVEVFNGAVHKRVAKIESESLYNHIFNKLTSDGFVEATEEEFILSKTEALAVVANA